MSHNAGRQVNRKGRESRGCRSRLSCFSGQSTLEYAAVTVVVASALVSMAIYLKRAVSGRLRGEADAIGEQYHPALTRSNLTLTVKSTVITTSRLLKDEVVDGAGTKANVIESTSEVDERTNRTGTENVDPMPASIWE